MKNETTMDLIIGLHSICEALKNPARKNHQLFVAEESWPEFESFCAKNNHQIKKESYTLSKLSKHMLQQKAQEYARDLSQNIARVPSGIFLITSKIEVHDVTWLYDQTIDGKIKKMIVLDGVSDVHNGGAILRSAAFYGVDAVIMAGKGSFGQSASFFRISSGATEYVPMVEVSSLPKVIGKLQDMGVFCIGLSEHAEGELQNNFSNQLVCLILGAEDKGLSHAVTRKLDHLMSINSQGKIHSLNVSVAAAIAMERVFRI